MINYWLVAIEYQFASTMSQNQSGIHFFFYCYLLTLSGNRKNISHLFQEDNPRTHLEFLESQEKILESTKEIERKLL